ncbi:choloylglycine hydrolase, partial [Dysgonomonas sp. GY617]|nr:choloylglycine hydrolase [Dysgonomonas sp. GY617]MBF0578080.1 choloylglycine hydrolase [Dysgonomonas sp. GY617]
TTEWRTVSDSKNLTYFFESSLTPNTFWVNLQDMDLAQGAPVMKLSIANGEIYNGNTAKDFKPAQPFKFLGVNN